jgi:hypothetical protein
VPVERVLVERLRAGLRLVLRLRVVVVVVFSAICVDQPLWVCGPKSIELRTNSLAVFPSNTCL